MHIIILSLEVNVDLIFESVRKL